jgi:8-oxo-dGTP diphosphatase
LKPVFNVRCYGLLISEGKLLVAEQVFRNTFLVKFPGGGLEYGEGLIDCLKREFYEETSISISVKKHFYTTDFFIPSIFHNNNQVIAVYYLVEAAEPVSLGIYKKPEREGEEAFRWLALEDLSPALFTLPGDRHVVQMLADKSY